MQNIIQKIKKAKLTGRGGACFATADKWQMVKKAKGEKKYIVCNASEGEPGIKKDKYLLENKALEVIAGIKIAIEYLQAEKAYIYLNPAYDKLFSAKLKKLIHNLPIEIFVKKHLAGYIGGEETSALNHIEGRRVEPRLRPPFPPQSGLWNCPTLVNNVETLYDVYLIANDAYKNTRLFTINGACVYDGVFEFGEKEYIEDVLKLSSNYPDFDFFAQVGGDASGVVLNSEQLKQPATGGASITIHSLYKHDPLSLMRQWIDFFQHESCGQCTPCREGLYRLKQEISAAEINWQTIVKLLISLKDSSFCALGCSVYTPFSSYANNVLSNLNEAEINLPKKIRNLCECL